MKENSKKKIKIVDLPANAKTMTAKVTDNTPLIETDFTLINRAYKLSFHESIKSDEFAESKEYAVEVNKHFDDNSGTLGREIIGLMNMKYHHLNEIGNLYSKGHVFTGAMPVTNGHDVFKLIRFLMFKTKKHINTKMINWNGCGATLVKDLSIKENREFFYIELDLNEIWANLEPLIAILKCYRLNSLTTTGFSNYYTYNGANKAEHGEQWSQALGLVLQNIIDAIDSDSGLFKHKSWIRKVYFKVYKPFGDTQIELNLNECDIVTKIMFLSKYVYSTSGLFDTSHDISVFDSLDWVHDWASITLFGNSFRGDYTTLNKYAILQKDGADVREITIYYQNENFIQLFVTFLESGLKVEKFLKVKTYNTYAIVGKDKSILSTDTPPATKALFKIFGETHMLDLYYRKLVLYTDLPFNFISNLLSSIKD